MHLEIAPLLERPQADVADVPAALLVLPLGVVGQLVGQGELSVTGGTFERL